MARTPRGFVYELGPIDFWTGWSAFEARYGDDRESVVTNDDARKELDRVRDHAVQQIKSRSSLWEGDFARGPLYAGIPTDDPDSDVMVAIKQSNNGSVFIWSPVELPWLAKSPDEVAKAARRTTTAVPSRDVQQSDSSSDSNAAAVRCRWVHPSAVFGRKCSTVHVGASFVCHS